jgi:hypothetical protein
MVVIPVMLLVGKVPHADAQEKTPDLRMLLNLDLFGDQSVANGPGQPSSQPDTGAPVSMLDQIRALNSMGYLGNSADESSQPAPEDNHGSDASEPADSEAPLL